MDPVFTSDITVESIGSFGGDWLVVDAARVSSRHSEGSGPRVIESKADIGLINGLIKQRHGAPFQHGNLTFYVEAPIFVFREWRTHRIAMVQSTDDFSYSEASARYRPLQPKFWVPEPDRPLKVIEGSSRMRPEYAKAEHGYYFDTLAVMKHAYSVSWTSYSAMIQAGVAPEVARAVLGTGVYSSMYVSCNPRSLMHFISLRTHDDSASFVSYPQHEIELAARTVESMLETGWPVTYQAFKDHGRFIG